VRTLALLLLLANLLFAAWAYWVAPPRAPAAGRATPAATDAGTIRLLREAPVESGPAVAGELTAADVACVSAGPYLERSLAEQAEARLQALGFTVRLREAREDVHVGDWVRVEELATPEDAANALAQLRTAGITDAYLLGDDEAPEAPGTVISLGVFADRAAAVQAETIARMSGLEPRTVERRREADVFWLDIDRRESGGLPALEQLEAGAEGRLPPIELQRCPSGADVAAEAGTNP
jgi:hypothetical protein